MIKVYKQETSERVKKRILKSKKIINYPKMFKWILEHEKDKKVIKNVKAKIKRLSIPLRFIVGF